jgi:PIN domain nuclease of toxin-antitoxin system
MRLLLDTHVFLWMATEPERLGGALVDIEKPTNDPFLSAASTWELAVKVAIGRCACPSRSAAT